MKSKEEINSDFIKKRRNNNLCYLCGKHMDRDGWYCDECGKKRNQARRTDRMFFKEHGICPRCGKERIFDGESMCVSCRAKEAKYRSAWRNVNREHYNEYSKKYHRIRYHKNTESGICYRCGKRKADGGYKTCGICREKQKEYKKSRSKSIPVAERIERGICRFCNEKVKDGYKVCERHYKANIEKSKMVNRKNHVWARMNKGTFSKKVN